MRLDYEKLSLDREGIFRSDGEEITHERTLQTYLRSLQFIDGQWNVVIGQEIRPVEVEDTAYFVRDFHFAGEGISIDLSDGTSEVLKSGELEYGPVGRLVARVKQSETEARFLRAPYHLLLGKGVVENQKWSLKVGDLTYWITFKKEDL